MGRATAPMIAREGAKAIGCDVHLTGAASALEEVKTAGGDVASLHPWNLTDPAQCQALVDLAITRWGQIDVLFNNAAMAYFGLLDLLIKAAWLHLKNNGDAIINTALISGILGMTRHIAMEGEKLHYNNPTPRRTGEEIWESTPYTNAADIVAEVVMDQQATGMQKFLGDRRSIRQIADAFQDAYNEGPQLECLGSLDELYKTMHAKREEDPQNKAAYIPLFYHYYCTSGQTHLGVDMNTLPYPGLKRVTFDDFLRTHGIDDLAGAAKALA
ncbi:hypothetical protein ACJZ2D_010786 [Fusarium nematophilum]